MNDPFAELAAANLDLRVRGMVLRSQVIKRLRARRAALKPALLSRAGSSVKKALLALARTWQEPPKLQPAAHEVSSGGTARREV